MIPDAEVTFPLTPTVDRNGRLFWWKGEAYRAIPADKVPFCERLFHEGVVDKLVRKGFLIETEPTRFRMDKYPLILKHRTLPFPSYAHEWCAMMLRDAAIKTIDMLLELAQHGLTLQDAHTYNVLFDYTNPVHVDFGSIITIGREDHWPALDEFCRWFLHSLRLEAEGYGRLARWLLQSHEYSDLQDEVIALTRKPVFRSRYSLARSRLLELGGRSIPAGLRPLASNTLALVRRLNATLRPALKTSESERALRLKIIIESIAIPLPKTEWSDYYMDFPPLSPSPQWTLKHETVHQVLRDLKPETVLEIGSNRGWYSQLAASLGSQVVSLDVDETAVTQLYIDAKKARQRILPLIMDFKFFTPARGCFCETYLAASERFMCDLVLAIALTHHLVFKQHLSFEAIAHGLALFTKRWLLVEFKPREYTHLRNWLSESYSWYTLESFVKALRACFQNVRIVSVEPESSVLLLCEK